MNRNHDSLIPDAPELIAKFLEGEQDMSCKRNAFMMLIHADQVKIQITASTVHVLWQEFSHLKTHCKSNIEISNFLHEVYQMEKQSKFFSGQFVWKMMELDF